MTKILVLRCATHGHIENMAECVEPGAREVKGADVVVKRVPELVPDDIARNQGRHAAVE